MPGPEQCVLRRVLWMPLVIVCTASGLVHADEVEKSNDLVERTEYAAGHVWLNVGLGDPILSIASSESGKTLALAEDGRVYRNGRGSEWREVLGAPGSRLSDDFEIDDEAILLDVEGFLQELDEEPEPARDQFGQADDETDDVEESDEVQPVDVPNMDADFVDLFDSETHVDGSDMAPASGQLVWKSSAHPGVALVARADGLWRSDDDGFTWSNASSLPSAHAFIDTPDGNILAGTEEGVLISSDEGRTWSRMKGPIGGIETYCFAVDGDRVYAGTTEGLFVRVGQQPWAKRLARYDSDVPVWAIGIDPHWENGLWVVGPVGVLRSDEGGDKLRSAGRNSLMGTVSILPTPQPGHLIAAGLDGVWESQDGGMRWRPIVSGLPSPSNRSLVMTPDGPMVAGWDGVFRIEAAEDVVNVTADAVYSEPPGSEMPTLVHVAISRAGMAMSEVLASNLMLSSMLLPKLTINGRLDASRMLQADHEAESNTGSQRRAWTVGLTACFGACGGSLGYTDFGEGSFDGYGSVGASEAVTVVGGEVYGVAETGSVAPMAANVAERSTRYRTEVASRVSELALARRRLLEASLVVDTLSLREQVGHELDILESTARLDVYTNGYFSRVLDDS